LITAAKIRILLQKNKFFLLFLHHPKKNSVFTRLVERNCLVAEMQVRIFALICNFMQL